ncbi:MAG: hypothetical protein GWN61_17755, partial [candidate division Zixibacteria bacterium]|nr:hypothetical protein [candidate division Zixibacteria bacterium]NIS47713.1 hypothetical protein [candidate division Zixibacteria bacterium]NIU15818.1 hypothetical protein [candidate division Zixibacteria bacterium]NIV07965.1 hypothetical protein [candidate division Zixibacteria bacterium]NIW47232.1 hypothetical protein [Gammaproteobacteria bacterium]
RDKIFYDSYYYAALVEREALFRQPEADQAEDWRWDLAYHYTLLSDSRSGALYSELIENGFNDQMIIPGDLPEWVTQKSPELTVGITNTLSVGYSNPG